MTDKQEDTEKRGPDFCKDMPFAEAMRKMMGNPEEMPDCCSEMMSRMMSRCCQVKDKGEDKV